MTGWNMPPGVNVCDIPGNRPEDEEAEAFYDSLHDAMVDVINKIDDDKFNKIAMWVWTQMGESYKRGYDHGLVDGELAARLQEDGSYDHD